MENLVCKNICKNYKEKRVLENINLTFEPGKIYGLIGRNGAGKTTLLSIMSAQAPATSGEVMLGNESVWENSSALANICFSRELSTNGVSGANTMKVKEYLRSAALFYPKWDKEMADNLVKLFELDVKQQIAKLSKGMMSMVTIIVALASKAEFTFMDEPVAGLDVVVRDEFYKLLIEEYTQTGRTFIVSTHIIDEASDVFEEVVVIKNKGVLIKENTIDLLERAYHVSGNEEAVKDAIIGKRIFHEDHRGRSMGVTVLLEEGQSICSDADISVQKVTLQQLFVALCGEGGMSNGSL